jgi:hypothetical protein
VAYEEDFRSTVSGRPGFLVVGQLRIIRLADFYPHR